ncbi:hypothetical protein MVES_002141 [Malassezia vespertilionis]|uniref:Inositol polyphosphate-related phosphatase domain-containing protein n=2 Tax=Malassezia vespertilionis TaxID=2020962 RepID=A0A2N1JCB9_9BASI|nr:hypothetical protein MVES_002141 [Malassezia vespertilionis]
MDPTSAGHSPTDDTGHAAPHSSDNMPPTAPQSVGGHSAPVPIGTRSHNPAMPAHDPFVDAPFAPRARTPPAPSPVEHSAYVTAGEGEWCYEPAHAQALGMRNVAAALPRAAPPLVTGHDAVQNRMQHPLSHAREAADTSAAPERPRVIIPHAEASEATPKTAHAFFSTETPLVDTPQPRTAVEYPWAYQGNQAWTEARAPVDTQSDSAPSRSSSTMQTPHSMGISSYASTPARGPSPTTSASEHAATYVTQSVPTSMHTHSASTAPAPATPIHAQNMHFSRSVPDASAVHGSPLATPRPAPAHRGAPPSQAPPPPVQRVPSHAMPLSEHTRVPPSAQAAQRAPVLSNVVPSQRANPAPVQLPPRSAVPSDLPDAQSQSELSSDEEDEGFSTTDGTDTMYFDDFPDISHMSRMPPIMDTPRSVAFKTPVTICDLFRDVFVAVVAEKLRIVSFFPGQDTFKELIFSPGDLHAALGAPSQLSASSRELRITAVAFCPPLALPTPTGPLASADGRFVWYGTVCGALAELDTYTGQLTGVCSSVHKSPIVLLRRVGQTIVALDESGKISSWVARNGALLRLVDMHPHCQRITLAKNAHVNMLGNQLWVSSVAMHTKSAPQYAGQKVLQVRAYNPSSDDRPFNAMSAPLLLPLTKENRLGSVTSSAVLASRPDMVFFGHDSGHITLWSSADFVHKSIHALGTQPIVAMVSVHSMLWVASRSGHIAIYDVSGQVIRVVKSWLAHRDGVTALVFDPYGLETGSGNLPVMSAGNDDFVHFWDGFLSQDWIDRSLGTHAARFSTYHSLRILNLTYNINAASPDDLFGVVDNMELFQRVLRNASSFASAKNNEYCDTFNTPDVIVFGFQELVDLEDKRLTAKRILLGHKRKDGKEQDSHSSSQVRAWRDKLASFLRLVLPPEAPYTLLLSDSLVGLFTCVFVKQSLTPRIRDPVTFSVKTGLGGHYGNKGALIARFVLDDASLCFVNCHLAAGQRRVRQRNLDVAWILQSVFPSCESKACDVAFVDGGDGTMILDHEICFFSGDLNYRLDMHRPTVLQLVQQQKFAELVEIDQLRNEMRANPAFRLRMFQEAPVRFPPTYKFNRLSNEFDTSEKARVPAYCDRILWRGHLPETVQCTSYKRWDATLSDHRPVSATFVARVKSIDPSRRAHVLQECLHDLVLYKHAVMTAILHNYHAL